MTDPSHIETLQQIWQRVFHRSPIALDADFFDLGGDAWLAAELFTEINRNLSLDLPPAMICNSPTIAALAASFENLQPVSSAILIKRGTHAPPIFMVHGIGSSVIDLVPLVRSMQSVQPIYGLEARGNDGKQEPLDRIEDIAKSFLDTICEIQPHGPYWLIGYSLGGLIALELAQQLKAKNEEVALLLMLDSYPDRRFLSFSLRSRLWLQLLKNRVGGSKNLDVGRGIHNSHREGGSLLAGLQHVKDTNYRALHSYRPAFYDGEIKFVRAAIPTRFPADPVPVWSPRCRAFEVETVPGEHVTMLTSNVVPLASLIDKYVRESLARQQALTGSGLQPRHAGSPKTEGFSP